MYNLINMTKKYYNLLAESIRDLKESGVSSGPIIKKIVDRFVEILNEKMKERFVNYKEDKFLKAINK